jgi:hypothetical protein
MRKRLKPGKLIAKVHDIQKYALSKEIARFISLFKKYSYRIIHLKACPRLVIWIITLFYVFHRDKQNSACLRKDFNGILMQTCLTNSIDIFLSRELPVCSLLFLSIRK